MKTILRDLFAFLITAVLLFTSCDIDFGIDDPDPEPDIPVVLEIGRNSLYITEGDIILLEMKTVTPENLSQYIMWSSSDTTVVKVDDLGYVSAIHEGTAYLKVTEPGSNVSDSCLVEVAPYTKCLTFSTAEEGERSVFSMTDMWAATIQYSYNRSEWVNYEEGTPLEFGNENLYIRGEYNDSPEASISSSIGHIHFDGDAEVRCTGNIMDLLNYHRSNETTIHSCYRLKSLFADCVQLIEAPELPAKVLAKGCYQTMFFGCTKLIQAPDLPATSLGPWSYYGMFDNCTSLTETPEILPAEKMSFACYAYMFSGCEKITKAPQLPATELDGSCYCGMFSGCASLSEVQEILPAQVMSNSCYAYMFRGCEKLTKAPSISATQLDDDCCKSMFEGCTSLTKAPALPAMKLEYCCYISMFEGCTSLTEAPELPALYLADFCYDRMFAGCVALKYIKAMFIDCEYKNYCQITDMIDPVVSGTFVKNAAATWPDIAVVKPGWTVVFATE